MCALLLLFAAFLCVRACAADANAADRAGAQVALRHGPPCAGAGASRVEVELRVATFAHRNGSQALNQCVAHCHLRMVELPVSSVLPRPIETGARPSLRRQRLAPSVVLGLGRDTLVDVLLCCSPLATCMCRVSAAPGSEAGADGCAALGWSPVVVLDGASADEVVLPHVMLGSACAPPPAPVQTDVPAPPPSPVVAPPHSPVVTPPSVDLVGWPSLVKLVALAAVLAQQAALALWIVHRHRRP